MISQPLYLFSLNPFEQCLGIRLATRLENERGADVVLRADLDQDGRAELDILLRDGGDVGRDDLLI